MHDSDDGAPKPSSEPSKAPSKDMSELIQACDELDAKAVQSWLDANPDVDLSVAPDPLDETPLMAACRSLAGIAMSHDDDVSEFTKPLVTIVNALLARNACTVTYGPEDGDAPMSLCHTLLSGGFDMACKRLDIGGRTALAAIANASSKESLDQIGGWFLPNTYQTALHLACKIGDMKAAAILIRAGASTDVALGPEKKVAFDLLAESADYGVPLTSVAVYLACKDGDDDEDQADSTKIGPEGRALLQKLASEAANGSGGSGDASKETPEVQALLSALASGGPHNTDPLALGEYDSSAFYHFSEMDDAEAQQALELVLTVDNARNALLLPGWATFDFINSCADLPLRIVPKRIVAALATEILGVHFEGIEPDEYDFHENIPQHWAGVAKVVAEAAPEAAAAFVQSKLLPALKEAAASGEMGVNGCTSMLLIYTSMIRDLAVVSEYELKENGCMETTRSGRGEVIQAVGEELLEVLDPHWDELNENNGYTIECQGLHEVLVKWDELNKENGCIECQGLHEVVVEQNKRLKTA